MRAAGWMSFREGCRVAGLAAGIECRCPRAGRRPLVPGAARDGEAFHVLEALQGFLLPQ